MILMMACAEEPSAPPAGPTAGAPTSAPPTSTGPSAAAGSPPPSIPIPRSLVKGVRTCGPAPEMAAPQGCVSGTLTCGATVTGTTAGGTRQLGAERYTSAFCFPATAGNHDAPERGYRFDVPAYTDVNIELSSPCVDLDLVAMAWTWDGGCPGDNAIITECEAGVHEGDDRVHLQVFNPREYFVLVDGKDDQAGPYTLTVTCRPLRRPGER